MNIKQFKTVYKIAKAMKCKNIVIMSGILIGTTTYDDITTSIVDTGISPGRLYQVDIAGLTSILEFIQSSENQENINDIEEYINHVSMRYIHNNDIVSIYNRCMAKCQSGVPVIYKQNIMADDNFSYCISLKSADGAANYNINDNYFITIYSGLFPINKNDVIDIAVTDITDYIVTNYNYAFRGKSFIVAVNIKKSFGVLTKYLQCIM